MNETWFLIFHCRGISLECIAYRRNLFCWYFLSEGFHLSVLRTNANSFFLLVPLKGIILESAAYKRKSFYWYFPLEGLHLSSLRVNATCFVNIFL